MSQLKECPFCGGQYETIKEHPSNCYIKCLSDNFAYFCNQPGSIQHTKNEMKEAWNTRYEQTCTINSETIYAYEGNPIDEVYKCSECGEPVSLQDNYCPNCGAKVEK